MNAIVSVHITIGLFHIIVCYRAAHTFDSLVEVGRCECVIMTVESAHCLFQLIACVFVIFSCPALDDLNIN